MKRVTLRRKEMGNLGTFGVLTVDGLEFKTGELPWRDNARGKSCIPAGEYVVRWMPSGKYGMKYQLQGVPARSHVLIHAANHVGDEDLGFAAQVDGCLALGYAHGHVQSKDRKINQYGVKDSRRAVDDFEKHMAYEPFTLTIIDEYLETGDVSEAPVA